MVDKKTITLKYTIPDGKGGETKELSFAGRLKTKHLKHIPKKFFDLAEMEDKAKEVLKKHEVIELISDMFPLIASLTDMPVESIEEIDIDDLEIVAGAVQDFLAERVEGSQETGKM